MYTQHRFIFDDSRNIKALADESVDLVITSPPYPMIGMWDEQFARLDPDIGRHLDRGDYRRAFDAMHVVLDETWQELYRVMKVGALACINVGDATRSLNHRFQLFANHSRIQKKFADLSFDILPLILWRKQTNAPNKFMGSGMLPAGAYVTLEHEYILIFRKGPKRKFITKEEKHNRMLSGFFWEERNLWFSDLWDFKGARQKSGSQKLRFRSGAFPLELPFRLVCMFSVFEDTVLDPFAGTGTTAMAAMATGRNSIGCEIDAGFFGLIKNKIMECSPDLNSCNLERIKNHLAFVDDYSSKKGPLKYTNSYFGFPVMSRQEKDMKLVFIRSLNEEPGPSFKATYFNDQYIQSIDPARLDMTRLTYDHGIQSSFPFNC